MKIRYAFNKLVRSFVIDKEEKQNKLAVSYKLLNDEDYKRALGHKLQEEAREVLDAKSKDELVEEIADCYEVLDAIIGAYQLSKEEILGIQDTKRNKKGGFEKRYFINYLEFDETHPNAEAINAYTANSNNRYPKTEFGQHVVDFCIWDKESNRIYVQKRSAQSRHYSSSWEFPGGKLESLETLGECVKRELKEETNLDLVHNHGIIYETSYDGIGAYKGEKHAYTVFLIEATGDLKLEEGKADEYKWISRDEIDILKNEKTTSPSFEAAKVFYKSTY